MTERESEKVYVHIRCGELSAEFEGPISDVFRAIVDFFNRIQPIYKLVSRIVYTPDVVGLLERLEGLVTMTPEGRIIVTQEAAASEAICICLASAYVASKVGILDRDHLTVKEISEATGKAPKTIRNELPNIVRRGLAERAGRGSYRITTLGLKEVEEAIIPRLKAKEA